MSLPIRDCVTVITLYCVTVLLYAIVQYNCILCLLTTEWTWLSFYRKNSKENSKCACECLAGGMFTVAVLCRGNSAGWTAPVSNGGATPQSTAKPAPSKHLYRFNECRPVHTRYRGLGPYRLWLKVKPIWTSSDKGSNSYRSVVNFGDPLSKLTCKQCSCTYRFV